MPVVDQALSDDTAVHDITRNPESIWLSPICDDTAHHGEGRTWAAPNPDETCEDCGEPWVKYVRVDLASVSSASAEGRVTLPPEIAAHVLSLGRVEWGQTHAHDAEGHGEHIIRSVRLTAKSFGQTEDQHMHGLWLAGTETVLCHTGTSPNAPKTTQALVGAWNWLVDQASASPEPVPATNQAGEVDHVRDVPKLVEFVLMVSRLTHTGDDGWTPPSGDDDSSDVVDSLIAQAREIQSLATQPATSQEGEGQCPASPDHADIKETIEDAADDWQAKGYTSALAEVRDMAAVGRSLMEALPKGYCYMDSPAEIVTDLQNELDEMRAATPTPPTLSEDTLDWSQPVEAIHTSGQVEPVRVVQQGRGEPHAFALIEFCKQYWGCTAGGEVTAFGWRIRNVARAQVKAS